MTFLTELVAEVERLRTALRSGPNSYESGYDDDALGLLSEASFKRSGAVISAGKLR